jgi:hypothetical protein
MRSQLEVKVADFLRRQEVTFEYEKEKLPYVLECDYIPDFRLANGIYLETKGLLTYEDRRKMLAVKRNHPEKDIRFVFMRPENTISSQSRTTYSQWCEKNDFPWCHYQRIPTSWLASNSDTSNVEPASK